MAQDIRIISIEKKRKKYKIETNLDTHTLEEDIIIKYNIFKDKVFKEEEFKKILEENKNVASFNQVLNFLSYRARSISEVKEYLEKKEVSKENSESIIQRLIDLDYLNDEAFASYYLGYYQKMNKGPNYIKTKLFEKKVDKDTISKCLLKYTLEDEIEIIILVLEKIKDKYFKFPIKRQKEKIQAKLLRDGFTFSAVNSVLRDLKLEENISETLEKDFGKLKKKYQDLDQKEKKDKIIQNLLRKGYEYSSIKKRVEEELWN